MLKIKISNNIKCEVAKKLDQSYIACVKYTLTLKKSLAVSYKTKHITTIQPSNYIPGYLSQSDEDMFTQNIVHKSSLGALFIRARNWKQPRYPLMGEQLPKPCCV